MGLPVELGGRWRTGGVSVDVCGGDGVGLVVEVCDEHGSSFPSFVLSLFRVCKSTGDVIPRMKLGEDHTNTSVKRRASARRRRERRSARGNQPSL